jgi:nucleoside-diphosphate-sugar epimerase
VRVLIVGGNRFMGYGLAWRLLAGGDAVTLFNRGKHPDPFGSRVERLRGDRTSGDFVRLLAGRSFDAAVDFAAFDGEDAKGAVATLGGNVGHYVQISSGQVYLVREGCPWPAAERDYTGPLIPEPEDALDQAEWAYGVGKRAAEDALAEAFAATGFPATCLRLPMVDGERDDKRRLEGYLWRLLDGGALIVPDGGARPVRHVYAGAVVRAIAALLGRRESFGQAYNLCQDEMPALPEYLALLAGILGAPTRIVSVPSETILAAGLLPKDVSPFSVRWMSCVDPAKAKAELGFRHEPLAEYLARIAASFLAHVPEQPPPAYAGRELELELAERYSKR